MTRTHSRRSLTCLTLAHLPPRAYDTLLPTLVGSPTTVVLLYPALQVPAVLNSYWIRRRYRPIHHHANRRHTREYAAWQCLANRRDGMRSGVSITNTRCVRRHHSAAGCVYYYFARQGTSFNSKSCVDGCR
eukprot:4504532-Prymnesium_polylepis.1